MIDQRLKEIVMIEARCAFEAIAHDYMECEGSNAEDAVEPTTWHMEAELRPSKAKAFTDDTHMTIRAMIKYNHPDHREFMEIVKLAVKGYFP